VLLVSPGAREPALKNFNPTTGFIPKLLTRLELSSTEIPERQEA